MKKHIYADDVKPKMPFTSGKRYEVIGSVEDCVCIVCDDDHELWIDLNNSHHTVSGKWNVESVFDGWSKPFRPTTYGQGPEGVSHLTHRIECFTEKHDPRYYCDQKNANGWWYSIENPDWNVENYYRYRPRTAANTPSGADGSAYYDLTIKGVTISCNDVIDALGLNFNSGNELKAIWRDGRKQGVSRQYDLEKRVYFAKRELERFKEGK